METIHEEDLAIEENESDEEVRPLTAEEKALLAKVIGTGIFVGAAATYGLAVATYQAGRHFGRKIRKYYTEKKEIKSNQ